MDLLTCPRWSPGSPPAVILDAALRDDGRKRAPCKVRLVEIFDGWESQPTISPSRRSVAALALEVLCCGIEGQPPMGLPGHWLTPDV
jgi:hypothetical protein